MKKRYGIVVFIMALTIILAVLTGLKGNLNPEDILLVVIAQASSGILGGLWGLCLFKLVHPYTQPFGYLEAKTERSLIDRFNWEGENEVVQPDKEKQFLVAQIIQTIYVVAFAIAFSL